MDSISNLSLLEIAAEDDSLLSDAPAAAGTDDGTASSSSSAAAVFSCSPLLLSFRSISRTALDSENASSVTKDGANNKENVSWNKPEVPKLNVEPQQMKRKKKGGSYNLRKSLAWDRAFLTEEGVLNPLELSMISGTATPKRANMELNSIQEEEPASALLALREIEENLFRQSSDGGVCIEDSRNIGAYGLSPKSRASTKCRTPASLAKRKVLAANDVVGNRSKRNVCPRPAASSSPDVTKAPSKESKVTKIPGPKSNISGIATTRSGTLSTGFPKGNQNAHLATNVQKLAGARGLSKNLRTVPCHTKVDSAKKCSVTRTLNKQAGKRLDNSVSETLLPSGLHRLGTGASKVVKACLPQAVSNGGEKKPQGQSQSTKPSGLRMPSPSLGFFSQTKASGTHNQLQKSSKPCKPAETNIRKARKLEPHSVNESRLPPATRKGPEIVEGATNICTKKLSLSGAKSEPSMEVDNTQMAGLEVESGSLDFEEISKQETVDIKKMAGVAVECDSLGLESISNQDMVENFIEHVNIKSKDTNVEDMEFPRNEQLEKEADHSLEDKICDVLSNGNQSVDQEPPSMHHQSMHRTLIEKGNTSNIVHNDMGQDEQIKLLSSDVLTSNASLVLQEKDGGSSKDNRQTEEFKEFHCVKTALVNSRISDFGETVLRGSIQGIPYKNIEQINDARNSLGGGAQARLLNGNLSVNCNHTTQSILEVVNQQVQWEQINTQNLSNAEEISSENENESQGNICHLLHVTTLSRSSPEKSMAEIGGACESEPEVAESEDCQHPVDDQSGSIQRKPVDEGYHQVIDSKGMHNRIQAFELDKTIEDCIAVSATVGSTEVNNASPESRPFYENNVENIHLASQLCPVVKSDSDSRGNDMLIDDHPTISEWQLKGDYSSMDTSMSCDEQQANTLSERLLRDDGSFTDTSLHFVVCCDIPGGNFEKQADKLSERQLRDDVTSMDTLFNFDVCCDVPGGQQDDASIYSEPNKVICVDQGLVANHGHLLDESEFSEVAVDFISNTKNSICDRSEDPSCLLQHVVLAPSVREIDHTNRESEEPHVEDEQVQPFVENPVVYNCNNEHCLSATNHQFLFMSDNDINEESHLSELQGPSGGVGANSQQVDNIQHLDGDGLPANTASSEFDHTNVESEEPHVEDEQMQPFVEDPVAYNCNNEHCLSVTNGQFLLVNDNDINEESHLSELQRPSVVVGVNSQQVDDILHLDGDGLPASTAYSEEIKNSNSFEGALEGCNIYTSECNASNNHSQVMPEYIDGNLDGDEMAVCLQMVDAKKDSTDTLPAVEVEPNHEVICAEFDYSIKTSEESIAEVVNCKSDEHCSSSENSKLPASDNLPFHSGIPQGSEVSPLNHKRIAQEAETDIFEEDELPNTEMQHQTKGDLCFSEDSSKITDLEKSATESKPEVPSVKLPPNVVPFSDEWLAAIEAAGEGILTMKGGAVQNSPPEKPQQEPGPWSPVKRKNQAIGPFDCTKHTNIPHSDS